ncbi:MAG: polyphosphate kinase [Pseudomonadota bacterium]|nr:polyphosphate kinase [Pseudomonadota bacterium]
MTLINKDNKNLALNREVGLIEFYRRVLSKATEPDIPLLERLTYLCIVCKNCDELFEVRVARLLKWNREDPNKILQDGLTAAQSITLIREYVVALFDDIYSIYHNSIIPELRHEKIYILDRDEWNTAQQGFAYKYFMQELKPVLTPIGIDLAHPFPRVPNKNLHFAVELEGTDQFGRDSKIAIVEAPRILPRVIKLPQELTPDGDAFILLQDIIKLHVGEFFYGLSVRGCYPFKVTRAADIILTKNTKNLRNAVTQEIQNRKFAQCSRLELDIINGIPDDKFIDILLKQFNISHQDLYLAKGPVNLSRLIDIPQMINRKDLQFSDYTPGLPKELIYKPDIFEAMDKSDILIHTPYQSFDPVVELTKRAAEDPTILAIKMTVYRTGQDSELVQNLIKAAKMGKQVIASVELFARFDEEINVELSNQLENAGAHVVYGVMGYKVHAKMLLLVRKKPDNSLKYYTHLGTGNYHQTTAKIYSDFSLLTTNPDISRDVDNIFAQITGIGRAGILSSILQAPFTLHGMLIQHIDQETTNAKMGTKAEIMAKMNSLLEPQIIEALYRASCAGVKIKLIVRGACSLRPQVKGLSENIEVRSIVGRFLEHHRAFYFYSSGAENVFISSADWMRRNFFRRVETCIPILDAKVKKRIINEGFKVYLRDNAEAWIMNSDGSYTRVSNGRSARFSAQQALMNKLGKPKLDITNNTVTPNKQYITNNQCNTDN